MRTRPAILIAGLVAAGFVVGWISVPSAQTGGGEQALNAVAPRHGGERAAAAAQRLLTLSFIKAPDAQAPSDAVRPPDVAVQFRRDLTAIEQTSSGRVAWIVDWTQSSGRRRLRPGDVYQDGWRITAVQTQTVELRRDQETRRVDVFSPLPGAGQ